MAKKFPPVTVDGVVLEVVVGVEYKYAWAMHL